MKSAPKKLLTVALSVLMIALTVPFGVFASAAKTVDSGECGENVTWELDSDGTLTVSGTGEMEDYYSFPIADNGKIKTVVVEDGVTRIGSWAFEGCESLISITIPDSVTSIGHDAFNNSAYYNDKNNWTDGVLYIGNILITADEKTVAESYTIKEGTKVIGDDAFVWCCLNSITIPDSVTNIGDEAFSDCDSLTSITIPDSVTRIGDYAFSYCSCLTSITIPDSVTRIGEHAVYGCGSLTEIRYSGSEENWYALTDGVDLGYDEGMVTLCFNGEEAPVNTENSGTCGDKGDNVAWTLDDNGTLTISGSGKMRDSCAAFSGDERIKTVIIEDGVSYIGASAFKNCKNLQVIFIPASVFDSVYYYDPDPDDWCGTEEIVEKKGLGAGITTGCSKLRAIFYAGSSSGLKISCNGDDWSNALYYNGVPVICDCYSCGADGADVSWTFDGDGTLTISGVGAIRDYDRAETAVDDFDDPVLFEYLFYDTTATPFHLLPIRKIVIKEGVTGIGDFTFYGCEALEEVVLPDGLKRIGEVAFGYCTKLIDIFIPESVTDIEELAFYKTAAYLDERNWSDNVFYLGDRLIKADAESVGGAYSVRKGTTHIEKSAFSGCSSLSEIVIPDSVTSIGRDVFCGCSNLTNVTLPNSVTSIGRDVFYGCSNLTNVTLPNSVTDIGVRAFSGCTALSDITIPNSVTDIGDSAFYGCTALSDITIPNSVTDIGYSAFYGCTALSDISLPNSVTDIGAYAFCNTAYYNDKSNWTDGVLYIGNALIQADEETLSRSYTIKEGTKVIADTAFEKCEGLESIAIPDGVTDVGISAFSNCTGLKELTLPDSVTRIAGYAFSGCENLRVLDMGSGVTDVGISAFSNCTGLRELTLPDSITRISDYAFFGCENLRVLDMGSGVTEIGEYAFDECENITDVYVSKNLRSVGYCAFLASDGIKNVYVSDLPAWWAIEFDDYGDHLRSADYKRLWIDGAAQSECVVPDGVTEIPEYAFQGFNELESILLPAGVKSLGEHFLEGATGIQTITVPNTVTEDEDVAGDYSGDYNSCSKAFAGSSVKTIIFEEGLTKIPSRICEDAASLTKVVIPSGVTTIGKAAFENCEQLKSIVLSEGVTTVGDYAFFGCSRLKTVTLPDGVTIIGNGAFEDCSRLKSAVLPEGVTTVGNDTFSGCSRLKTVTLPDGVTIIGNGAFEGCKKLSAVSLPDSVTVIGDSAFSGCAALKELVLPPNLESLGASFLDGVPGIKTVVVPKTVQDVQSDKGSRFDDDPYYTVYYWSMSDDATLHNCNNAFNGSSVRTLTFEAGLQRIPCKICEFASALTTVKIPDSVTEIGRYAFRYCNDLTDIFFAGSEKEWKALTKGEDPGYDTETVTVHFNCDLSEEGTTQCGITDEYGTEPGTTDMSATEPPVEPSTEEPVEPSTTEQITAEQTTFEQTEQMTAEQTTAEQTITEPTTEEQTTAAPSTTKPITAEQTTAEQTITEPTTEEQTTAAPTTTEPTTTEPTTAAPTTAGKTTAESTAAEPTTGEPVEKGFFLGDVNKDGKINAKDARAALRISARLDPADELTLKLADSNQNGKVQAGDARLILRHSAKLEKLPDVKIAAE